MKKNSLIKLLSNIKGATFATLEVWTIPLTSKEMKGKIVKRSKINCTLNCFYSNSVNLQRQREGKIPDFIPQPRKWGIRLPNSPFVEYKGKLYLEVKVERVLSTKYYLKQKLINYDTIKSFLLNKKKKSQVTKKEIILRDYCLDNIKSITLRGQTITLE